MSKGKLISLRIKKRQRESDLMQDIEDRLNELLPTRYDTIREVKQIVPLLTFETEEDLRRYEKENGLEKNIVHIVKENKAGEIIPWTQEK